MKARNTLMRSSKISTENIQNLNDGQFTISTTFILTNFFASPIFLMDFVLNEQLNVTLTGTVKFKSDSIISVTNEFNYTKNFNINGLNGFTPEMSGYKLISNRT